MRLTMALAAAALCLGMVAPGAAANGSVPHFLMRTVQRPEVAGAPALVLAAALDPRPAEREEWGELLLRVARGGFNAVYVNVPWNVGKKGSLAVADLDAFLAKVAEAGLKAIIGPPIEDPFGLWGEWLAPIQPVLEKPAAPILWLRARDDSPQGGAVELAKAAQALKCALPVTEGVATPVTSQRDPLRPYREPEVSVALRTALAEGATALVWDRPFAGTSPPLISIDDVPPAVVHHGRGGALPIAYYEAHLFSQVARCLGDSLTKAQPAEGAAADAAGVAVTQRNVGRQGFLFVRAPAEPVQRFHLSFTDPESGEKMTVPRTQGLSLRSFGAGARVLPLNLPVPGATIRYSTCEVYGIYQVGERTVILVTDDDGGLNEIALKLEGAEKPTVRNAPVEPVWDAASRTLTVSVVPSFAESFMAIGEKLILGVVPTERAQRTWSVRYGDATVPMITSAYLVGQETTLEGKIGLPVFLQQGRSAVSMVLAKEPRYLAVDSRGAKVAFDAPTGVLSFFLQSPVLLAVETKTPIVQVLDRARLGAGLAPAAAENAQPELDDSKWPEVRLDKAKDAGWYRVGFSVPALENWILPWKATLEVTGKAVVYLNGEPIGTAASTDEKGGFVDLDLPSALIRSENTLAFAVEANSRVRKVGISPHVEDTVQRQLLIFFP